MLKTKTLLTIDPGKGGTGYAVWDYTYFLTTRKFMLIEYGVWNPSKRNPILSRYRTMLLKYFHSKVVIENAAFMDGDAKTQMVARSGALVKLAQFIGRMLQLADDHGIKSELLEVAKWKGTLSKEITKRRILKVMPNVNAKSHDWDAIGQGLYYQGILK